MQTSGMAMQVPPAVVDPGNMAAMLVSSVLKELLDKSHCKKFIVSPPQPNVQLQGVTKLSAFFNYHYPKCIFSPLILKSSSAFKKALLALNW